MSNNLDEIDGKKSGIIKLKNPNNVLSDKIKESSHEPMSDSEGNEGYKSGRWNPDEHYRFIKGCLQYGNNWKKVKECVKTRSSAQIRSHAQKYIIKLCKKFNIQESKNLKSFKNMKRKSPTDMIDDCNWEKALEWTGNENFESSNLNLEEIEEIILGIFKTNVAKNACNMNFSPEEKEKAHPANDEKKTKVFETIKEPKNFFKKKPHRIHLQNQAKKGNTIMNDNGSNYNNYGNNLLNMSMINQLGLTDPHLQMILGNNMMPNGMNMNLGNFAPNMGINNFNNQMGWDQMLNGMNFNFPGAIPSSGKKEENLNKNNSVDNNLLSYLFPNNMNCMDFNNDEVLRNLMKANSGINMNNIMGGYGNSNGNPSHIINSDPQSMDNINMFNDLVANMLNSSGNSRGMMPINEMMMHMYGNNQSVDTSNNKNIGNASMNAANNHRESNNIMNNLIGLPNISNMANSSNNEKNVDEITSNSNNNNFNPARAVNPINQNATGNLLEDISDNLGDISKLQSFQQLANAIKMFTANGTGNSSTPNELISNMPEIFNTNNIGSLFNNNMENLLVTRNNNGLDTNPNQMATSNSNETNKETDFNARRDPADNANSINPSKPNDNLLSDDVSMMLLNLLNSSNPPQLPVGYDLNSFSQLFDMQNLNNLALSNNNMKKQNDSASNLDQVYDGKERENEDSNQNKTQISANHNINNNLQFNSNSNVYGNNSLANNMMGGNFDFNINPNLFQQQNLNNFIGDPLLGLVNQFLSQPNNLMPNTNTSSMPMFNSKSQIDNYYLNNFNPMDLYFDPNMMNQSNGNSGNNKNFSEK